jgi:putative transposase
VLEALHSDRFVNDAPAHVYATLLDEETYLASLSTMYRLLAANGEIRERRDQLRRPNYTKPELLATKPNELWSWDITNCSAHRSGRTTTSSRGRSIIRMPPLSRSSWAR